MDVRINSDYNNYLNSYTKADIGIKESTDGKKTVDSKIVNTDKSAVIDASKEVSKDEKRATYYKKDLDKSINKLNKFLEDEKTHAEYSKHKDLGTLMVKIVDDENDKVLMELPPEKILDMVASMCKQVGILDKKA